jgi:hypothetical protein
MTASFGPLGVGERGSQPSERGPNPGFDRAERDFLPLGDFPGGEAPQTREHYGPALFGGQSTKGVAQPADVIANRDHIGRVTSRGRDRQAQ